LIEGSDSRHIREATLGHELLGYELLEDAVELTIKRKRTNIFIDRFSPCGDNEVMVPCSRALAALDTDCGPTHE
jgi:hypothetical protein